jgi:hypothetical protein
LPPIWSKEKHSGVPTPKVPVVPVPTPVIPKVPVTPVPAPVIPKVPVVPVTPVPTPVTPKVPEVPRVPVTPGPIQDKVPGVGFIDFWSPTKKYSKDERVKHGDIIYICLQDHTSNKGWTPDSTLNVLWNVYVSTPSEPVQTPIKPPGVSQPKQEQPICNCMCMRSPGSTIKGTFTFE